MNKKKKKAGPRLRRMKTVRAWVLLTKRGAIADPILGRTRWHLRGFRSHGERIARVEIREVVGK